MAAQLEEIPRKEMEAWLHHPTTKLVLSALRELRQALLDQLSQGRTLTMHSVEQTAMQTTLVSGRIYGLNSILELSLAPEDKDANNDGEHT